MKILHILHRSLPGTHGYAIRSKYIVECQKQLGLDPVVITSPFQSGLNRGNGNPEYINSIPYYRTNFFEKMGSREVRSSSIWLSALRFPLIILFARETLNLARRIKPSIIHAHSPFYCGLIASWVSKRLGIPSIYEVRGIWEGASGLSDDGEMSSVQKIIRSFEDAAMQKADAIVVISEHLQKELLSRGRHNAIHVIPNGVDTRRFHVREKNGNLLRELNLEGKSVLGYMGTFSAEYEGLEYLIRALPRIINKCPRTVLLLVGDGRLKARLEVLVERIGVKGSVIFTGRVPYDRVSDYYSVIDICVYPRKRTRETELVTALKPLEAMAMGKAIIGSNVGGLQELISDGKTGILFEADNTEDLAEKCNLLIKGSSERKLLGDQARQWVQKNREWAVVVTKYKEIYEGLDKGLWKGIPLKKG